MTIKLGLVFVKKYQLQQLQQRQNHPTTNTHAKQLHMEKVAQQPKGISLRRVVGAPKTGCKSCRG